MLAICVSGPVSWFGVMGGATAETHVIYGNTLSCRWFVSFCALTYYTWTYHPGLHEQNTGHAAKTFVVEQLIQACAAP